MNNMQPKQTVLITGASRGLGLALVRQFLREHWLVYALVRKEQDLLKLKDQNHLNCLPILGNISDDQVKSSIKNALNGHHVDLIINNAGLGGSGVTLETTSADDIASLFNIHCLGALRVIQAVMPFLSANGIIINISSRFGSIKKMAAGELDIPCSYSYRIAKAGQNMLTQCIRQEYKDSNLKICSIHPGQLKTALASPGAEIEPEQAAMEISRLIREKIIDNGKYYSLFAGELEW